MASMALSFGSRTAGVRLVASRRVDFRLQRHSFSRWKYRQVERFIAASAAIRGILVSDGIPATRIDVVHDGIDVERVAKVPAGDIHQAFWFPKGAPVVVNVGALVGHKGQKFLVEAMAQVRRQVPDAQLVIFGEGDLREPLTRQIRDLGLDKHVVLAGFRDDVHALTRSADLFVMSSVTEGLGSAVLDAMALGLPVVGTRAGGIPEAVEEGVTGLLVPPRTGRGPGRGDRAAAERPGGAGAVRRGRPGPRRGRVRGRPPGRRHAGGVSPRAGAESNHAGSQLSPSGDATARGHRVYIAEIWRYPVKSMAGERLTEAMIAPGGIAGDRRLHVEDARGRIVTARTHARLLGHRARTGTDGQVLVDDRPWFDPASPPIWLASPAPAPSSSRPPTACSTSCRCSSPPTAPSRRSGTTAGGCARTW